MKATGTWRKGHCMEGAGTSGDLVMLVVGGTKDT